MKLRASLALIAVLTLATLATAAPAEAKFRPGKFLHHAMALSVGIITAPILLPEVELSKRRARRRLIQEGAPHSAIVMINGFEYDWMWSENWW